jgi:hypothetical protein
MTELEQGVESKAEVKKDPKAIVKRWLLELKLAEKRERDWRKQADDSMKLYRQKDKKKHAFNIQWSMVETMRPALYNSTPVPDVRRRFRDEDPLGKAVSEVMERALSVAYESINIDGLCRESAMDILLPGRAVWWVRYVPSIQQSGEPGQDGYEESLDWEQAVLERVAWDDYRQGPGKCDGEVPWKARRHKMNRETLLEKFGELGRDVPLDEADDEDVKAEQDKEVRDVFKTAVVWEVWNRDDKQVLFIAPGYKERPLKLEADPLQLKGFFPCPKPAHAVELIDTTVPITHYEMYREQAEELNRISARINKLVDAIRANGIYDSRIEELSSLMKTADNDLVPAKNVAQLLAAMQGGGLDKLIWMRPIDQHIKVLSGLYEQREATKQVIYELTGISDILRGASEASETATAQQIKANWGSLRIKDMQKEFQRLVRDGTRLMAEVIGQTHSVETLKAMTGLEYPMQAEKEQAQMQAQQASMMGQPVPPELQELLMKPSWEEIMGALQSDAQREFKVDIETDSTVSESIDRDMQGLRDVLGGIVEFTQGIGPAVQAGAVPIEAAKETILAIIRRAKLGIAVEDAFDKMQAPQPQVDPAQMQQMQQENEQLKGEAQKGDQEAESLKAQMAQTDQMRKMEDEHRGRMEELSRRERELAQAQEGMKVKEQMYQKDFALAGKDAEIHRMKQESTLEKQAKVTEMAAEKDEEVRGMVEEKVGQTESAVTELAKAIMVMAEQMAQGNAEMRDAIQQMAKIAAADTELIKEPGKPARARKVLQ